MSEPQLPQTYHSVRILDPIHRPGVHIYKVKPSISGATTYGGGWYETPMVDGRPRVGMAP